MWEEHREGQRVSLRLLVVRAGAAITGGPLDE
jgi:hypothetical protein